MKTNLWRCNLCHKVVESVERPPANFNHGCVVVSEKKRFRTKTTCRDKRPRQGSGERGRIRETPRLYNSQWKKVASKAWKYL